MTIKELKINKLYGFMNKSITFKNNISILVGINGSGKTSVLNLINWLLTPSFSNLSLIEFEEITLSFIYKEDDYILKCYQNKIEIVVNISNISKNVIYNPIQSTFDIHPKIFTKNDRLKEKYLEHYDGLQPEEHEEETWKFLSNEIPTPTIIGLDRDLYIKEGNIVRIQEDNLSLFSETNTGRHNTVMSPLEKVKRLLNEEYNEYKNKTLVLYSQLSEKIMLSAFDDVFTDNNIEQWLYSAKPTVKSIDLLRKKVLTFLLENNRIVSNKHAQESTDKINIYFNNLKNIIKNSEIKNNKLELTYLANISQFKKINDLIISFSNFEQNIKLLYKPLKDFLDTVNTFLSDSSKQLYFNEESSEIKFNILDKVGVKIEEGRDINNLSSGEKQILILLTYLKYNNHNSGICIIDEPELSLHPKWQGEFLDAVDKLMPKDSQLIVATHSPEIIGNRKRYCSVLLPYNE